MVIGLLLSLHFMMLKKKDGNNACEYKNNSNKLMNNINFDFGDMMNVKCMYRVVACTKRKYACTMTLNYVVQYDLTIL